MFDRGKFSSDISLSHWMAVGTLIVSLTVVFSRYLFMDWSDPYRCDVLMSDGQWLDDQFKNWQPDGGSIQCIGRTCPSIKPLTRIHLVFVGDSVTRQLFFQTVHAANRTLPSEPLNDSQKHRNYEYTSGTGTVFSFVWDPFLNSTQTRDILTPLPRSRSNSTTSSIRTPAMVVIGVGLWFLRYPTSGGLPVWEKTIENTIVSVLESQSEIADMVVVLPVETVVPDKLTPDRQMSLINPDVEAMNADIQNRIHDLPERNPYQRYPGFAFPSVFNKMLDSSQTTDGLHYSSSLVAAHSNILFNLRCNDMLPKTYPFDKTCCASYPRLSTYQLCFLLGITLWGPISYVFAIALHHPKLRSVLPSRDNIKAISVFGSSIFLIHVSDRTNIFLKEHKHYNPWLFGVWSVLSLIFGLYTVQKGDKDLGFLSRQQTDEWKGWMQIAILIYHYMGASKVSGIYNPIRVLVAAYLFMTGYGHTTYFLKKADFSIHRVAQVLVRLNLLPIALAYTMNTDYLNYYFSPLVSMWFLIIYTTMAIAKKYNERTPILLAKVFLSMASITFLLWNEWFLRILFIFLSTIFHIKWSLKEWSFRVTLDLWIVYCGMLAAITYLKIREHRLTDHPRWPIIQRLFIILSIVVMVWFIVFELSQPSKYVYNKWHPYVSVLPVGAFVILRNATPFLRSVYSRLFTFVGVCSLETFIVQYHLWLAADTKGILTIIPGSSWRLPNLLLTSIVFIWISHTLASATNQLTLWICDKDESLSLPVRSTSSGDENIPLHESSDCPVDGNQSGWTRELGEEVRQSPGFRLVADHNYSYMGHEWFHGVTFRCLLGLSVMWLLNLLWAYP